MGSSGGAPGYAKTTTDTGLFGQATTSRKGATFSPTDFQKKIVGVTESNAVNALRNYLNPNYESEDFLREEDYYNKQLNNQLQNNYLNPALSRNLLRGSTASDIVRGFGQDLADTLTERQNNYRNQQLQNYQAAMLPYTTIYDMMQGTQGLSNNLSNAVSSYNLAQYQANKANSGLGSLLGGLGGLAGGVLGKGGISSLASGASNIANRYIV